MQFKNKPVVTEVVFGLVMLLLLIGIGRKIAGISITNDEAYSFYLVKTNYINALVGTANTHWVNSVFIKLETMFLGNEVWMWRLHMLFFFSLYMLGARAIAVTYFDGTWKLTVFLLLTINPYLNDFFSIARGYGPAIAFMSWAIYFFAGVFQQCSNRTFFYACLCASLAVLSNYTLLYFFLPAGLFIAGLIVGRRLPGFKIGENKMAIFITVGTLLFAATNLVFIKYYTGDLDTGGDTSLLYDTIGSLIKNSSYGYLTKSPIASSWVLLLVIIFLLIFAATEYSRVKKITIFHFVIIVLQGALMIGLLFHLLFQTPYNEGRTAVYLYPLFILSLISGIVLLIKKQQRLKKGVAVLLLGCSMAAAIFAIRSAFTEFCFEARDQVGIDEVMMKLKSRYTSHTTVALPSWHFGVHVNYFQLLRPDEYAFRTLKYEYPKTGIHTDAVISILKQCDVVVLYPASDTAVLQKVGFPFSFLALIKKSNVVLLKKEG